MNPDVSRASESPQPSYKPSEPGRTKNKRDYSRGGCRECKRRKIKCNEAKPSCFQCSRLNKKCSYPKLGERILRVSRKSHQEGSPVSFQHYTPDFGKETVIEPSIEPALVSPPKSVDMGFSSDSSLPMLNGEYDAFNINDLNGLASDLNNIVNDIFSNIDAQGEVHSDGSFSGFNFEEAFETTKFSGTFPRDIQLNYIKVGKPQEAFYLEEFYNDFSNIITPLYAWDSALGKYVNPARDILLTYAADEPFLLAAVLAQGARTAFNKNGIPEDESAYKGYLSRCLKLLGPALAQQADLISNIEAVLLTVLLLTTSNASTTKQNWRPHLRGAKDLLLKNSGNPQFTSSKVLIFCKYWFVSFEILAGLSSKLGGTLKTDQELDTLLTTGTDHELAVLKEIGIVTHDNFNILGGYHNDCIVVFRDFMRELQAPRTSPKDSYHETVRYLRLVAAFTAALDIQFVHKDGVVESQQAPGMLLEACGSDKMLSWKDVSHQVYMLASLITTLTTFMGVSATNDRLKGLQDKLVQLLCLSNEVHESGSPDARFRSVLLQWPMFVAGNSSSDEASRFQIMKFFRKAAQLGSGSAGYALRKLQRKWDRKRPAAAESSDDLDMVTY